MESIRELLENLKLHSSASEFIESIELDSEIKEKIENNFYSSEELESIVYSLKLPKYETSQLLDAVDKKRTDQILDAVLQSKKGQYFETLFALCILFGVSKWGKDIDFYKGNSNKKQFIKINDFREVLDMSVSSGNTGGWSDISFYDKKVEKTIISTSKFYKNDSVKPIDAYEIHKLGTLSNNDREREYLFAVFCKDKANFNKKWESSNSSTKIGNIGLDQFSPKDDVFDLYDLDVWCRSLIELLDLYNWDYQGLKEIWFNNDRKMLVPMYHQELAYENIKRWKDLGGTEFLLAHKPRAGKTVSTALYCINEKPKNVLLLTNLPCLNSQWKETFQKYEGLPYYINDVSGSKLRKINMDNEYNMVMLSFQDLKYNGFEHPKFDNIRNVDWDLMVIDEVHFGKETHMTDQVLSNIQTKLLLGLSATPTKNLLRGTFSRENTHFWGSEHEQEQKRLEKASNRHGMYSTYPDLEHYVYSPPLSLRKKMNYYKTEESLTFHKFLSVLPTGEFKYKKDVSDFLVWLRGGFGNDSSAPFKIFNPKSVLIFVDNISQQEPLKKLLDNDPWFGVRYSTYLTNSKINDSYSLMLEVQNNFIPKNDKGSIIIAVDQLRTGVTLKECDTVIYFNDMASMDNYIQAGYRCQSPSKGKEKCRTIDFLSGRVFNILNDFILKTSMISDQPASKLQRTMLDCMPIFECIDGQIRKIDFNSFKTRVYYNVDIGKNLIPPYVIENIDKKELKKLFELNKTTSYSETISQSLDEDENFKIPKGTNYQVTANKKGESTPQEKNEYEIARENLIHILNRVSLGCVFTDYKYDDLDTMLDELEKTQEVFGKRTLNVKKWFLDSFDMDISIFQIKQIIKKTCDLTIVNSRIQAFNWNMKKMLSSKNSRDTKNAIVFLSKYVISNRSDFIKYADIPTPFWVVEKMVDLLDESFFENKYAKVLDPCCGFGQFSAVLFERFMVGLEDKIPDENQRKQHILENIIYTQDIIPKYSYIYNQIFNFENNYDLNIKAGSYLSTNTYKDFSIANFDLIITNPPYNKPAKTIKASNKIYDQFIEKSIKEANKVIYIIPAKWFTSASLSKFRYNMLNSYGLKKLEFKQKIFDDIQMNSGFSYFLLERGYNSSVEFMGENRIFEESVTFIDLSKLEDKFKDEKRLSEIYTPEKYFGIRNKDERFIDEKTENSFRCFTSKKNGSVKYVDRNKIEHKENIEKYKVLVNSASGSRVDIAKLSKPIIGLPGDVCSRSYIHFPVNNKTAAESLKSYLESKFVKMLVRTRKQTQSVSKHIFEHIPMVPLNRQWTDEEVYKYFRLGLEDIELIETNYNL